MKSCKSIIYVFVVIFSICFSSCNGDKSKKADIQQTAITEIETNNGDVIDIVSANMSAVNQIVVDYPDLQVFYAVWQSEEYNSYYVSKSLRLFIVEDTAIIEEIPHEPFNYHILDLKRQGDSLITATIDDKISWMYLSKLLVCGKIAWHKLEGATEKRTMTFRKNKEDFIWHIDIDGEPLRFEFINTFDILPSGYRYQNQSTKFHNPDNEVFTEKKEKSTGVFDLTEIPLKIEKESREFGEICKLLDGIWLQIDSTDIGYVVYNYPNLFDDGETQDMQSIGIDGNTLFWKSISDPVGSFDIEEIAYYQKDKSYSIKLDGFYFSFKWIDETKHIGQWTTYGDKKQLWGQKKYIQEQYNPFPIMDYSFE